ncbi:hypothetical protein MKW98_000167 [Papaver atlanticum]|uniref:3'-5' exonuclease domain-containing protein n=1 Tax=Papaver atlanticum TaxID=357466 RepID=A0AAD4SQJ3_9MAGN|nr:hypothetical protein MKW98_000167 [Papaver atlanticum]
MAGSSLQKEVQNGLAVLSLGDMKKSDKSIEVVDKSQPTHQTYKVLPPKDVHTDKRDVNAIRTTVTHTASVVDRWIAEVYTDFRNKLKNLVVGLDIEWSRKSRENFSRNKVAVLQLCLSTRCLIFQISRCDEIPESLADFLSNESFIFVGAGIDGDAHKLWVDYGLYVGITEEVGSLAAYKLTKTIGEYRESGFYKAGLKNLAKDVLSLDLPKERKIQTSNWNVSFLTEQQIEYACLDAFVSFKLGIHLRGRPNLTHVDERRSQPKKFFKDSSEPKKAEEEGTEQVSDKANGTKSKQEAKQVSEKKTNGTKSKR